MTERRFVFAPLERRGVIAGLTAPQVGVLGGALVVVMLALRIAGGAMGVLVAVVALVGGVAAAFVPVGGRPIEQWVPPAARHVTQRLRGRARVRFDGGLAVPVACAGLSFEEMERPGLPPLGVIVDTRAAALTAVLAVRGRSFALLDAADKERRLGSWSSILAGLSREGAPVRSVQWIERLVPGDAEALQRHYHAHAVNNGAAGRSYEALIAEAGPLSQQHECLVAVTVRAKQRRSDAAVILDREIRQLQGHLRDADVEVVGPLDAKGVGGVLRTAFDPWARRAREGCPPAIAWPVAADDNWSSWRTDNAWHATFWVAQWPRSEVGPDFLAPLLIHTTCQRSVAVIMAPLPPSAGVREAEAARTAHAADEQLRQRAGFLTTARRQRQAEGIALRESELSDGHAAYRYTGFVTVTAQTEDALAAACGELVQAGYQARLELRLLCGLQDVAFGWTMPIGRGMR